jgi:hypothetical protein
MRSPFSTTGALPAARTGVDVELRLVSLGCVVLSRGLVVDTEVFGSGGSG